MKRLDLEREALGLNTDIKGKKERASLKIVAWFRILLWWGADAARRVLEYRRPNAQIQRVTDSHEVFPISSWVFTKNEVYCMVFQRKEQEIIIQSLNQFGKN